VDPQARRILSGTGKRAKGPGQQPARICESIEGYTIQGDSEEKINILGILMALRNTSTGILEISSCIRSANPSVKYA